MNRTLFPVQEEWINNIQKKFRAGKKKVIGQALMGFGKSLCMAHIAKRSIEKGNKVCVLVHREEIFKALYKDLRSVGISPSLITAGSYPHPGSWCYLGMVQTASRRMTKGLLDHLGITFFMCDEVHDGNYEKLVKELNCHVLGVTATPESSDAKPPLNESFEDIVLGPSLKELIALKRLVPAITYSFNHDWSKIKKKKNGKEYDDRALLAEFRKPVLRDGGAQYYHKYCPGVPAVCYNLNIDQNLEVANQFRDLGYRAVCVDSLNQAARQAGMQAFMDRKYDILCNVGIATTGTDLPFVRAIIKNFATMSTVKDWQTGGRGGRWDYEAGFDDPKEFFHMIDMGRNYFRHGKWTDLQGNGDEVNWEEKFHNGGKLSLETGIKRTNRECDDCGAVIQIRLKKCPYCQCIISEAELEKVIISGANAEEIREYRLSNLPVNLRKPTKEMSYHELVDFARHMGYKPSWVHIQQKFSKQHQQPRLL